MKPTRPQLLPELRADVIADDNLWHSLQHADLVVGRSDWAQSDNFRYNLSIARLWWIGEECCEVLEAVAPSMPPATLTPELMPDIAGFACFERSLSGIDADDPDNQVVMDYVSWMPAIVIEQPCISIIYWRHFDYRFPLPLGRSDWPINTDVDYRHLLDTEMNDHAFSSVVEDRRLLAAMWQLSSQRNLVSTTEATADRASTKRMHRRKLEVPSVRVVNVHKRATPSTEHGHVDREYSHRWIVGAHWRQQACGPRWSQHRPMLIAPYIKGPDDKPLVITEQVKAWTTPTNVRP